MAWEDDLVQAARRLTPEQQERLVAFVNALVAESSAPQPRRSIVGLCADLGADVTAEDIAEARREMWGGHG